MFPYNPRVPRGYSWIWFLPLVLASVQWGLLEAAAPALKALEPRGAQQGKVFTLTLKGEGLTAGAEVSTPLPGSLTRLAVPPDLSVPDSELPFLVELKETAPVGLYPIRVRTDEGLSNTLLFSVGTLPEVVETESLLKGTPQKELEKETNDSPAMAQKITLPVTVNGTLKGPDRDYYRFTAKAGERWVFEVEARRAGSAIDPVIRVLDGSGKEIAKNNDAAGLGVDARVEVSFAKGGEYYALVHDAKYSDQEQNFYRLMIGSYSYADGIFPLGWQRGATIEVSLFGGNLKTPVKVKPDLAVPASSPFVPISLPGGASLPLRFVLSDLPEIIEPSETTAGCGSSTGTSACVLPPSTVVNGRISRPGEIDKYRLSVSPGQQWTFEVEAAGLGTSQLDPLLSLFNPKTNKRLALAGLTDSDPYKQLVEASTVLAQRISFTVPKNVKEILLAVEDLLGRGGPNYGYRLLAKPQSSDFALELLDPYVNIPVNGTVALEVAIKRQGYMGPIRLTIRDLPEDITMDGGNIPAEPYPTAEGRPGYITMTAKPGAKLRSFPVRVWGEATSADPPFRKLASAPGMMTVVAGTSQKPFKAPWLGTELNVAVAKAQPASLDVGSRRFRMLQGSEIKLPWKLVRPSQMNSPVDVDIRYSYFLKDLVVVPKPGGPEHPNEGYFQITAGLTTPALTFDFVLDAIANKSERIATAPAVTLEIVPLYGLKLFSQRIEIRQRGKFELAGKVEREPGFIGPVKVRAEGLPEHISCSEIEIPPDQSDFRMVLEADPEAKPGEFEVHLASSATLAEKKEKQEYSIPDLKARLIVSAETAAVQAGNAGRN